MLNEFADLLSGATDYIWVYCDGELYLELSSYAASSSRVVAVTRPPCGMPSTNLSRPPHTGSDLRYQLGHDILGARSFDETVEIEAGTSRSRVRCIPARSNRA